MKNNWRQVDYERDVALSLGRLGVLRITRISTLTHVGEHFEAINLGYEVFLLPQGVEPYSEDMSELTPRIEEMFPFTDEGLETAKKRAIEWAMELLQEAMDSLKGGEEANS